MGYETVIGLEVHTQLLTQSKMFCGCAAAYADAAPNTHVCPVCLGMPGVLPVINGRAIELAALTALALHCDIPAHDKFDRKNYMYPDLPKGYQVSQYDLPLSHHGWLEFEVEGDVRRCGITRVHVEEDTGRLLHRTDPAGDDYTLVDFNRSGVPLLEIVGEPDLRTAAEAGAYLRALRQTLRYIGVSTGNMEEGSFRCDANVSIRPVGSQEFGAKVEIKNLNSFRAVERAIAYEARRQEQVLAAGGRLIQETRGWVDEQGVTAAQRTKEHAHDYRYFPEPDLPPLTLSADWVVAVRAGLPELPAERRRRFQSQYGLGLADVALLTEQRGTADYYEAVVALGSGPERSRLAANWLNNELRQRAPDANAPITQIGLAPERLHGLLALIEDGTITAKAAREQVLPAVLAGAESPRAIVDRLGLAQVSDDAALRSLVRQVIADHPQPVADYCRGKEVAARALIGPLMKATRGSANPQVAHQILLEELKAHCAGGG
ncbi:MAG: Asp-tRNA(Asn)/Glu-tRNA(Gln) amidotransferase subunit GatB [Chloroflexi bacterium]|nr:Asp-tRNA(Asn)/Glu-tRNA(Gln) amidotransferase subunit GatB [Chloroflexota bacterium]